MKYDNAREVGSVCNLIDILKRLRVIDNAQWLKAHDLKWTILGKPEWVKRS